MPYPLGHVGRYGYVPKLNIIFKFISIFLFFTSKLILKCKNQFNSIFCTVFILVYFLIYKNYFLNYFCYLWIKKKIYFYVLEDRAGNAYFKMFTLPWRRHNIGSGDSIKSFWGYVFWGTVFRVTFFNLFGLQGASQTVRKKPYPLKHLSVLSIILTNLHSGCFLLFSIFSSALANSSICSNNTNKRF